MTDADDFFGHKKVEKKKKEKKREQDLDESEEREEGEWYIEDPDKKPDRVAFVKVHSDHEVKTGAS